MKHPLRDAAAARSPPGELVRVDAHSPVMITLPSAVGNALAEVVVKEVGGGGEAITIAAPASEPDEVGATTVSSR